jgi:adenylate cyclase
MTMRRLATILSADVVGFSAMMEKDEASTLRRVKELQHDVLEPSTKEHGGRLVKTTGDGFLVEFNSPSEALLSAITIQQERKPQGNDLQVRIGINLGEILVEADGDIYGDDVNRGGSGFLDRCDEWSFCLTAARMVAEQERR